MGGSQLNKYLLFKYTSALIFSGAIFSIVTQEFMIGYSLLVLGHLQISGSTIGCLALVCAACSVVLNCCWIMLGTEVFIPILIKAESMNLQERQSFFFSVSIIYSCIICTIVLSCIVSYFLLHYL